MTKRMASLSSIIFVLLRALHDWRDGAHMVMSGNPFIRFLGPWGLPSPFVHPIISKSEFEVKL